MARPTSAMPALCSWLAELISPTISVTRRTLATTSVMVAPACSTSLLPVSTLATESSIKALISLAAEAERWARERTSEATTAKPRPCSPARAASTAAFKARILVWKAIPSITPMMSAILRELSVMPSMVCTTWLTTLPPWIATSEADSASWLAWRALSAFCLTVAVSCSMAEAVSSSEPACCSVRPDRSRLPLAISCEAVAIVSAEVLILVMVSSSESRMLRTANSRLLRSPGAVSMLGVRSPWAMRLATSAALAGSPPMVRRMPRLITITRATSAAATTANRITICHRLRMKAALMSSM